jgi:hypothetical protein
MLKFLLGLIITTVGIPILTLILLLDFSPDIPVEYYEAKDPQMIVEEEINRAIAGIDEGKLALSLSEENINNIIYNVITQEGGINPNYAPGDDCIDDDCNFIQYQEQSLNDQDMVFGVTGMWIEFYDDVISLNVSVKGHYLIDFQTRLRLEFEVEDNVDEYKVTYSKIRIGNIPLPKAVIKPIVNLVVEQANLNVSDLNNEYLTVEIEELRAVVDKSAMVEQLADDPGAQAGLNLIFDNSLVTIDVFEEPARIEVYVDLALLSVDSMPMNLESDNFDLEAEITRQMNNIILSVFAGDPKIIIDEDTINHLVSSTMGDLSVSQIIPLGETDLDISVEGIWLELHPDEMELNFQLRINQNHLLLEVNTIASSVDGDLIFTINEAYLGRDAGEDESEYITIPAEDIQVLAGGLVIENELFNMDLSKGEVVISSESISEMLSASSNGVTVDSITVIEGALQIDITLPQQEILEEVIAEVTEVLDDLEGGLDFIDDTNPEEAAFEDKLQEIAGSIDIPGGDAEVDPEDLDELTELYNEMDEDAQADFIEYLEDSVDPDVLSEFIDSFGG